MNDPRIQRIPSSMPYPFSTAVRVGDVWELSGQIGWDSKTNALVPGGVGPETRQALDNIRQVLEQLGSSMDDVIKVSVFLKSMDDFDVMNSAYGEAFSKGNYPARSAVAVAGLALGASVEIECSAVAAKS
jgi:reactive intermediate/imine deaminase